MSTIGVGVIGAGLLGDVHARVYQRLSGIDLIAICDLDEDRARTVSNKYGVSTHYTNYQALLNNADIQAVSIATPDFAHAEIAIAAAQAGKHILCEKPLATTVEAAQAIVEAAQTAGIKLMND